MEINVNRHSVSLISGTTAHSQNTLGPDCKPDTSSECEKLETFAPPKYGIYAVSYPPPPYRKTGYKLVQMLNGVPCSLFTGTPYPIGKSFGQAGQAEESGALHFLSSQSQAVLADVKTAQKHPPQIIRLVKVSGWCAQATELPQWLGPKKAYPYFRVVEVQQVPPTYHPLLYRLESPLNNSALQEEYATLSDYGRPSSAKPKKGGRPALSESESLRARVSVTKELRRK